MMLPADSERLTHWVPGLPCVNPRWEAAYNRFETPAQERAKFRQRLESIGVPQWPRDARIADLFCGSGNNLTVLEELGFTDLLGVDLSPDLLRRYRGPARLFVGDCTDLRLDDASCDYVIVQGGMHHLPRVPEDVERCLREIARVLRPGGKLALVEPWDTPFLRIVHGFCRSGLARRIYPRLDALAVMIEEEAETYFNWLGQGAAIRGLLEAHFRVERLDASWGKLLFVGSPKFPA